MAIKNRQVLKALFAKHKMARELANLLDSALIRSDDAFYGKWNPNVVYENGDIVTHGPALYMLVINDKATNCEEGIPRKTGRRSQQPPDAVTSDPEWFNITDSKIFYIEEGSKQDGIYFIKKETTDFDPFEKPSKQGTEFLHIAKSGKVKMSNYKGKGMHLQVTGALTAKKYYQPTANTETDEILDPGCALDKLQYLKPLLYRKKKVKFQEVEPTLEYGFDPQSLTATVTEILHPEDTTQVDFQGLIPVLVKAIQELNEQLIAAKKKTSQLEQSINAALQERAGMIKRLEYLEGANGGGAKTKANDGY